MSTKKGYRYVIGLTGPIASGKGLVAKMIHEFVGENEQIRSVLLSDYIREVVRANGLPLNRDTLREAGNARRKELGPGTWVEKMLEELPDGEEGVLIVDSIRNPGEIQALRDEFGENVLVIAADAPFEDRVKRVLKRAREDDSTDTDEIKRQMSIEMEHNPEFGFAIEQCKVMSDVVSVAKETKEERKAEINERLQEFVLQVEGREVGREREIRIGNAA